MNKQIKRITLISGCIISLLLSYGCSDELFVNEHERNENELIIKERTSTRIDKLSNLPEFHSFVTENIIHNKFSKSAETVSIDGEKNVFVIDKNGTRSYSVIFYNENGFDILVYNKGKNESSMIVQFIPSDKTKNNSFEDFTGIVKYFSLKGTLLGENKFENAKPIVTPVDPQTSNKSNNCTSTTVTIAFPCNSGKHYPGDSCELGGSERAYYEYYTYTSCYVDEFPYPDGGGGGFGNPDPGPGGGGGSGLSEVAFTIYLNTNANLLQKYISLSDDKKQYIEYLFFSQAQYLTEFAINLLSSNSSIELYQFVKWVDWYKGYKLNNSSVESYFMQNPQDLDVIFYTDVDFSNAEDVDFVNTSTNTIVDLLINNKNNTLSNLDYSWPNLDNLKQKVKNAISKGIYTTAKYTRDYLYIPMVKVGKKYPSTIYWSNKGIDKIRLEAVTPMVNFNENTMNWSDLFNIWLFELTPNKYANNIINFTNSSNIINGNNIYNPSTNAVKNFPKGEPSILPIVKTKLANGTFTVGSPAIIGYFNYNVNAFYSTLSNANIGIQMLGSFPINAKVLSKSGNTAVVQFYIYNDLGWESGTRFIKGENGTPNQGIIKNKDVGSGLHLGGTITNTFTWTETVTF
ncbi:hypothetical protein [Empedobacter brevis]|uniref:hypothetical protein n=1 Tax=Empedobacter brevis TaxID=247 RepID=UPI0028A8B00E|nr:hypothetical protein [Empedobacter brevis]